MCCAFLCYAISWQVAKPYFDECLGRQFNRLKKASVKTSTYLDTHAGLLELVLPKTPLKAVLAAKGDWAAVDAEIQLLLGAGNLGKSLFTFAGLSANAASFQREIGQLLDIVVQGKFSQAAIDSFKIGRAHV